MARPRDQFCRCVIVGGASGQPVKAEVKEISRDGEVARHGDGTKGNMGDLEFPQKSKDGIVQPGGMPEFHGIVEVFWELSQKTFQPFCVFLQMRRKLPEDRAKVLAQWGDALKENGDGFAAHVELFHVSNKTAAFDGIDEPLWRLLAPFSHCTLGREPIKGVIDFDRWELRAVKSELAGEGQVCGIKASRPPFVDPAAGANV